MLHDLSDLADLELRKTSIAVNFLKSVNYISRKENFTLDAFCVQMKRLCQDIKIYIQSDRKKIFFSKSLVLFSQYFHMISLSHINNRKALSIFGFHSNLRL